MTVEELTIQILAAEVLTARLRGWRAEICQHTETEQIPKSGGGHVAMCKTCETIVSETPKDPADADAVDEKLRAWLGVYWPAMRVQKL